MILNIIGLYYQQPFRTIFTSGYTINNHLEAYLHFKMSYIGSRFLRQHSEPNVCHDMLMFICFKMLQQANEQLTNSRCELFALSALKGFLLGVVNRSSMYNQLS